MEYASRTVLMIGAAMVAGGMMEGAARAQAPATPAPPASQYPTPEAPRCIVNAPTDCRTADGHPDLTGLWVAGGSPLQNGLASGADGITFAGRGGNFVGFEADGGLFRESSIDSGSANNPNMAKYKPEFWDRIIELDYNGNFEDPQQFCMPPGLPRLGAPSQIIQMPNMPLTLLMYNGGFTRDVVRQVWTDGRKHNPFTVAAETWNGDPVGHWEGDTLVIESIGFTDASWLHKNAYIHGFNMKVTEKLTRTGNTLRWNATVEDPEYLTEPWVTTPVMRNLNLDPNAVLVETVPCMEIDREHETAHVRSG
jgi:hypothetical protein